MYRDNLKGAAFWKSPRKAITLLGMSGVGKTTLASRLPRQTWFHYSGDYRIGTRYLDEPILDNVKREAMRVPFLAELLRTDSIYLCHNISVHNLKPIASFLGMIGNPELGGLSVDEFKRRQSLHREAEINAMQDVRAFISKGHDTYGYPHFLNDAGGSLCEIDAPGVLEQLAEDTLIVYLKPSEAMLSQIIERSLQEPKPMYYQNQFLDRVLPQYLEEQGLSKPEEIVPDDYFRWMFPRLVEHRLPRYQEIADRFGVVLDATRIDDIHSESEFLELICDALE
ncbi:MAG TPA: ATPase [Gammaproteobacteria bacterium]|jgi:energy-coupling factor transporter ATP-binding protein EcfA2|nr:ATPase [Gammaproteobacteria bacterium]HCL95118.1 ATPase [Gammaproteobacteria bacterium]|tara:strand:- start:344 stop:1189 length:846 start_codon:yes stop_codon:yes gene_type:complete